MANKNRWYIGSYMKQLEKRAERSLRVVLQFLVGDAKLRVAVDTGNLKNSIAFVQEKLVGAYGTNIEYAGYIELGTEKMEAMPFLEPALRENYDELNKLFNRTMRLK